MELQRLGIRFYVLNTPAIDPISHSTVVSPSFRVAFAPSPS
ncbi:MAG: hypothetical protein P4L51_17510 [Puia sp.]|nr:hypothetical protein [Puia sp.]